MKRKSFKERRTYFLGKIALSKEGIACEVVDYFKSPKYKKERLIIQNLEGVKKTKKEVGINVFYSSDFSLKTKTRKAWKVGHTFEIKEKTRKNGTTKYLIQNLHTGLEYWLTSSNLGQGKFTEKAKPYKA